MPAPANDNFASAVVLSGLSGTAPINNVTATYETGEPVNTLGADGLASVWYKLTTGTNGGLGWHLTVDTDATPEDWDSTLEVFTGTSLSDIVVVGSGDDINYPTDRHSLATATIPDSTTCWVRVDQWAAYTGPPDWSGAQTSDGVLTWSLTPVIAPPTITGWTRTTTISVTASRGTYEVWSGEDITVTGTNLDALTSVTVGGGAVPWDVTSSTEIVLHVGDAARSGPIVVTNGGGSASSASVASDPAIRFPGPWVSVGTASTEQLSTVDGFYRDSATATGSTAGASTQPAWNAVAWGAAGAVPGVTLRPGWSVLEARQSLASDGTYTYQWDLTVEVITLDATPTQYNMPVVTPASADWPAHAVNVDSESDHGTPTTDPMVSFGRESTIGDYKDSTDKDALTYPGAVDVWDQDVELRRITLPPPSLLPDRAALTALPIDAAVPGWIASRAVLTTSDHASTGTTTNYAAHFTGPDPSGPDPAPEYVVAGIIPWADWPADQLAWLPVQARLADAAAVVIPGLGPPHTIDTLPPDGGLKQLFTTNRVKAAWTYQPPRYRFVYDLPPVTTPTMLRRRQQAAPVGSAPRRRQIANRAGSPRRGPGAAP